MKKFIFLFFIMLILPASAHAMTVDELAGKLQESYNTTRDMKADFTQVSTVKAMNMRKEGKGTLLIKKPGMLRYVYTKPDKQELIVRGGNFIMYTPSTNQVVTKKLDRAVMDKTPSTFLAGLGRITDSFDARFPNSGDKDKDGRYVLELIPKGDRMGIEKIVLTLDPESYFILAFSFTETSGNTNTITLSNIKTNTSIKDSAFAFKIPTGASIISQ